MKAAPRADTFRHIQRTLDDIAAWKDRCEGHVRMPNEDFSAHELLEQLVQLIFTVQEATRTSTRLAEQLREKFASNNPNPSVIELLRTVPAALSESRALIERSRELTRQLSAPPR